MTVPLTCWETLRQSICWKQTVSVFFFYICHVRNLLLVIQNAFYAPNIRRPLLEVTGLQVSRHRRQLNNQTI